MNVKKIGKVVLALDMLSEEQRELEWDMGVFMFQNPETGRWDSDVIGWSIRKGLLHELELYPTGLLTYGIRRVGKRRVEEEEEILGNLFDIGRDVVYSLFYPYPEGRNDYRSVRERIEEYLRTNEV